MLKKGIKIYIAIVTIIVCSQLAMGQQNRTLTLSEAIRIATDSSLSAFKAKNLYLSSYWTYRTYLAKKKPTLTLNTSLFDYNRSLTKRYNSTLDIDEYREQQNINSYANASVNQNLPFSGGSLSFDTELGRLQNFGENDYTQFSTVPFKVSLTQPILAFNTFKWQRKIEPLRYEKAKKDYLESAEDISAQMVDYFFNLLVARKQVSMTTINVANSDTLYNIGQKRLEIASLSLAEVLTLKVAVMDSRNNLSNAKKQLKNAEYSFYSYLRVNENTELKLFVPENLPAIQLNFEEVLKMAQINNPDLLGYQQQLLESARNLEQTKRNGLLNSSLRLSYGLNQQNPSLSKAYINPMDQQRASLDLSIPILDWGQRKGNLNIARKNLEVTKLTVEQANVDFCQQVMMAVNNFNMQPDVVKSSFETFEVAQQAYELTKQRFVIGKADVNSLSLALNRQDQANLNYLNALRDYWKYFYTIRQLTLYDFEKKEFLSRDFDQILNLD